MQKCSAFAGTGLARRGAAEFLEHVLEFGHVFKAFVDRSEAHVCDRIQLAQLVHHEFAQTVAANFALAAARALMSVPDLPAEEIARRAMGIAADICVYTNRELVLERLD